MEENLLGAVWSSRVKQTPRSRKIDPEELEEKMDMPQVKILEDLIVDSWVQKPHSWYGTFQESRDRGSNINPKQ